MPVEGLDALERRWRAIPDRVRDGVRLALEAAAEDITEEMRRLAPKGETLALVNSIGWTWGDAPAGSMVIGTVRGSGYGAMRITIYAGTRDKSLGDQDAFYAVFQEFGTSKMTANPFFFPVWRAKRRGVRSRITRAINKAAREV